MLSNVRDIWGQVLGDISQSVSEVDFRTWFGPIEPIEFQDDKLLVKVPNRYFCEDLESRFINEIGRAIRDNLGSNVQLAYRFPIVQKSQERPTSPAPASRIERRVSENRGASRGVATPSHKEVINPFESPAVKLSGLDSQLMRDYIFDNYIEGKANRLARSAGAAIAVNPGYNAFNPFVIYGKPGVGKTHLAQAIGAEIKEKDKSKRVLYVTAERFTAQFIEASLFSSQDGSSSNYNSFINFYQTLDVLILDDVQALINKKKTQQAFFTIFNYLHQNNKQLIITCDTPPGEMKGMNARLISRFKWKLVAEIGEPCIEMRKDILRQNAIKNSIVVGDDVIDFMANNVHGGVRELEGSIISLMAHSAFEKGDIDLELASKVTGKYIAPVSKKEPTIKHIVDTVCKVMSVDKKLILSRTRKREVALARQIAMYLSKQSTNCALAIIGEEIGKRDHSTVVYACKTIGDLKDTDKTIANLVQTIQKEL